MSARDEDTAITADELVAHARVAGVRIEPERLPRLLAEMNAALVADTELDDAVRRAGMAGGEPFDPRWDTGRLRP